MTTYDFWVGFAVCVFILAGLALAFAIRAVMRRTQAGRRRVWGGLVARGVLIAGLLALGMVSLLNASMELVNHPSPAAADAVVAFIPTVPYARGKVVEGVSARDGSRRWTWTPPTGIEQLTSGPPGVALVTSYGASFSSPRSLSALRLTDGAPLWSYDGVSYDDQPPVYDGARVYAPVSTVGGPTRIVALDAASGAVLWRVPMPASVAHDATFLATSGMLVVAGAASDPVTQWHVVALRAADGAQVWTAASGMANAGPGDWLIPRLAATRDVVFVAPGVGALEALDAASGAPLWTGAPEAAPGDPLVIGALTAAEDTLYEVTQPFSAAGAGASFTQTLAARDAHSGRLLWSRKLEQGAGALHPAAGALVYTDTTGVRALDATTGAPLWRWESSVDLSPTDLALPAPWSSPLVGGGGELYIMRAENDSTLVNWSPCLRTVWFYAVNARSGEAWWRIRMGATSTCHMVL